MTPHSTHMYETQMTLVLSTRIVFGWDTAIMKKVFLNGATISG